jgi:hypothetical protein
MSGVLFLLEIGAMLLVILWFCGAERAGGRWRLRLLDMEDEPAGPETGRPPPRWRAGDADRAARTPEASDGRRPPGWRRGP